MDKEVRQRICRIGLIGSMIVTGIYTFFIVLAGPFGLLLAAAMTGDIAGTIAIAVGGFIMAILHLLLVFKCWNVDNCGKWGLFAGILMILEGLVLVVQMLAPHSPLSRIIAPHLLIKVVGTPLLLISGFLFILSWRDERKQSKTLSDL